MAAIVFPTNPAGQTPINTFSTTSTPLANTTNSYTYTWNGTAWTSAAAGASTPTLAAVTSAGNSTVNTITVGGLTAASLSYPTTDGSTDQVLKTDGAGILSWVTALKVASVPSSSADPGQILDVAVGPGFFYFHDGATWLRIAGTPF